MLTVGGHKTAESNKLESPEAKFRKGKNSLFNAVMRLCISNCNIDYKYFIALNAFQLTTPRNECKTI